MEQHRAAQHKILRHRGNTVERMLPYIVAMVIVSLIKAYHRQDLRPEYTDYVRIHSQNIRRIPTLQQL